jgi:hypothetical protein
MKREIGAKTREERLANKAEMKLWDGKTVPCNESTSAERGIEMNERQKHAWRTAIMLAEKILTLTSVLHAPLAGVLSEEERAEREQKLTKYRREFTESVTELRVFGGDIVALRETILDHLTHQMQNDAEAIEDLIVFLKEQEIKDNRSKSSINPLTIKASRIREGGSIIHEIGNQTEAANDENYRAAA